MRIEYHELEELELLQDVPLSVYEVVGLFSETTSSSDESSTRPLPTLDGAKDTRETPSDSRNTNVSSEDMVRDLSHSFSDLVRPSSCDRSNLMSMWYAFFVLVGREIDNKAISLPNAQIALPADSPHPCFEATASMLVSYGYKKVRPAESAEETTQGIQTRSVGLGQLDQASASCRIMSPGGASEDNVLPDSHSEETPSQSDGSNDSYAYKWLVLPRSWPSEPTPQDAMQGSALVPLGLPRDAHVTAGIIPSILLLPVICVAETESLAPILSSLLAQRRVWDIDLPVIGVEISPYSSIARVYVAWGNPIAENEEGCIHLLSAYNKTGSVHDVFEMTEEESAVTFYRFLVSLRYQFSAVRDRVSSALPGDLVWRYDSSNPRMHEGSNWLQAWAESIPNDSFTETAMSSTNKPEVKRSAISGPNPTVTVTGSESGLEVPADDQITLGSGKSATGSQKSSSRFSKSHALKLTDPASISSWMCYRSVMQVPVVKISVETEPKDAYDETEFHNSMVDKYNSMTDFYWPAGWDEETKIQPINDWFDRGLRKELFSSYQQALRDGHNIPKPLEPRLAEALKQRLPIMFLVVHRARMTGKEYGGVELLEADTRLPWDLLLQTFLVVDGEVSSPFTLLERDILYAKNTVASKLQDQDFLSATNDTEKLLSDSVIHSMAVAQACRSDKLYSSEPDLIMQALSAEIVARGHKTALAGMRAKEVPRWTEHLRAQAREEPERGKADAVLCVTTTTPIPSKDRGRGCRTVLLSPAVKHLPPAPSKEENPTMDKALVSIEMSNSISIHANKTSARRAARRAAMTKPPLNDPEVGVDARRLTFIPFVAEYKKRSHSQELPALHQLQMYCVTSVKFQHRLGLEGGLPVWGLGTDGVFGTLIMGSMSPKGVVHLYERNIVTFDLEEPMDVLRVAIFLLRVRQDSVALLRSYYKIEPEVQKKIKEDPKQFDDWIMAKKDRAPRSTSGGGPTANIDAITEQLDEVNLDQPSQ